MLRAIRDRSLQCAHFQLSLSPSGRRNMSKALYAELSSLPVPTSAQFWGPNVIQATFSVQDHTRNAKLSTTKSIFVSEQTVSHGSLQDITSIVASLVSPSGTRRAILRESSGKGQEKPKRHVEIWKNELLDASHDVTDTHGVFYTDDYLSSLSFSPSESSLIYSAEAKPLPATTDQVLDRFRFKPTFGEGLSGRKSPTLYVFKWSSDGAKSTALSYNKNPTVLFGTAVYASEDRVFATGHEPTAAGRMLGVKGCFNHQASIWDLKLGEEEGDKENKTIPVIQATRLTEPSRSARGLRVHKESNTIYWVSEESFGSHAGCAQLHSLDLSSSSAVSSVKTVVDTVMEPEHTGGFPGLYLDPSGFSSRPFLTLDGKPYIITHSTWHSGSRVLLISLQDKNTVRNVTPSEKDESIDYNWNVLGTDGHNRVICARSAPGVPHELVLGTFRDGSMTYKVISKPHLSDKLQVALAGLKTSIVSIPDRHPVETILLQNGANSDGSVPPLVTIPHGGPHATTLYAFSAAHATLALSGYSVSLPNYTGSLGFGQKYVEKLLGQCGKLDVEDCIASVNHLVSCGIAKAGPGMQFIQGGSHGGFLSAHLIGQYPDVFSAAVMRNPVISLGEISNSDIPDWYYLETGFGQSKTSDAYSPQTTIMTPSLYTELFNASPIAHVDKVQTPVMLHVGEADERVSPTQGVGYYYALKGRGKEVELLCFPGESHPLDGVESSRVSFETGFDWLEKYSK